MIHGYRATSGLSGRVSPCFSVFLRVFLPECDIFAVSSDSRVTKLLVDQTVRLSQGPGLHRSEGPGRSGAVRPGSVLSSPSAILDHFRAQNGCLVSQLHREAPGGEGLLHDGGGPTGYRQSHGGDVRLPVQVSLSPD